MESRCSRKDPSTVLPSLSVAAGWLLRSHPGCWRSRAPGSCAGMRTTGERPVRLAVGRRHRPMVPRRGARARSRRRPGLTSSLKPARGPSPNWRMPTLGMSRPRPSCTLPCPPLRAAIPPMPLKARSVPSWGFLPTSTWRAVFLALVRFSRRCPTRRPTPRCTPRSPRRWRWRRRGVTGALDGSWCRSTPRACRPWGPRPSTCQRNRRDTTRRACRGRWRLCSRRCAPGCRWRLIRSGGRPPAPPADSYRRSWTRIRAETAGSFTCSPSTMTGRRAACWRRSASGAIWPARGCATSMPMDAAPPVPTSAKAPACRSAGTGASGARSAPGSPSATRRRGKRCFPTPDCVAPWCGRRPRGSGAPN